MIQRDATPANANGSNGANGARTPASKAIEASTASNTSGASALTVAGLEAIKFEAHNMTVGASRSFEESALCGVSKWCVRAREGYIYIIAIYIASEYQLASIIVIACDTLCIYVASYMY